MSDPLDILLHLNRAIMTKISLVFYGIVKTLRLHPSWPPSCPCRYVSDETTSRASLCRVSTTSFRLYSHFSPMYFLQCAMIPMIRWVSIAAGINSGSKPLYPH